MGLAVSMRSYAGMLASVAAVLVLPGVASAETITVDSAADVAADDGSCILREAITAANTNAASGNTAGECAAGDASPTEDVIEFAIAGAGPHVIAPATQLPDLDEVVTIDGSTDGADEIALDGDPNDIGFGLRLEAPDITVSSLSIYGFGTGVVFAASGGTVEGSFIGTNQAGAAGIGNSGGLSLSSTGAVARGNVVSGNDSTGISVFASEATVAGNLIGTNPAGSGALSNGSNGIRVTANADSATIGGPAPQDGNLISGNDDSGISATETASVDNAITGLRIEGNRIGTRLGGEVALANGGAGVAVTGNLSGFAIERNLVSGNTQEGINVGINVVQPLGAPGPSDGTITGNLVGTDKDGEAAIPNGQTGISVSGNADHPASDNSVGGATGLSSGGPCTGDCNLTSGNSNHGILVNGETPGTQVLGNFVGTDVTGAVDVGNAWSGVLLNQADDGSVGSPGASNVVSGNGINGIELTQGADGHVVQSNLVGVAASGAGDLGNEDNGVLITGTGTEGNLVGGTGAGTGNVIANSGSDGVLILGSATDNSILGNSLHANDELGIDLENDGVTSNDAGDSDAGVNDLQNFPELSAVAAGGSTVVKGSLDSTAGTDFRIEVFANPAGDPSSHGEGEKLLGVFEVTTDGSGEAEFAEVLDGTAGAGEAVSATATELDGGGAPLSTSEFALNVPEGTCDVTGTAGDDAELSGTPADEVICGMEGDDVIDGGGGADVIVGGDGTDEVDYSSAAAEIDADLAAGVVTGPGADGDDILAGVEDLRGTDFADVLAGDDLDNFIFAGGGKDTVTGGDGDDELKGKDGGDTLKGEAGDDQVKGQDGGDTLRGGGGENDDLSGGAGKDNLNGGGGSNDFCNGGGNKDDSPAKKCETVTNVP